MEKGRQIQASSDMRTSLLGKRGAEPSQKSDEDLYRMAKKQERRQTLVEPPKTSSEDQFKRLD